MTHNDPILIRVLKSNTREPSQKKQPVQRRGFHYRKTME